MHRRRQRLSRVILYSILYRAPLLGAQVTVCQAQGPGIRVYGANTLCIGWPQSTMQGEKRRCFIG